jgi:hypothetical protein
MHKIRGGEFEISPALLKSKNNKNGMPEGFLYSSGRAALYHILQNVKIHFPIIDTILLPDYLCRSIIETVKLCCYKIKYYKLTDELTICKEKFCKLYTQRDAVLVINYFGISDTEIQIEYIQQLDAQSCIILDNVQAFYEMYNPTLASYSFTSFRKWFPTPDGAVVKTKMKDMFISHGANTFAKYKVCGSILKNFRNTIVSDDIYLSLFDEGEQLITQNMNAKISDISVSIFSNLDIMKIAVQRKKNAKWIIDSLTKIGVEPVLNLKKDKVPLFVPIRIARRDYIRDQLFYKGFLCPIHWPVYENVINNENKIYTNELSIIIDQRYSKKDMLQIAKIIKQCLFI